MALGSAFSFKQDCQRVCRQLDLAAGPEKLDLQSIDWEGYESEEKRRVPLSTEDCGKWHLQEGGQVILRVTNHSEWVNEMTKLHNR